MLKLAALGAIGYFGYNYYKKNGNPFEDRSGGDGRNAVAGGPIGADAVVTRNPDMPPV